MKASWTLGSGVWVNDERMEVVLVEEGGVGVVVVLAGLHRDRETFGRSYGHRVL